MAAPLNRGIRRHRCSQRRAFTLIELLVAMGIIGILAMLLLGVVIRARHHARDATCKSHLGSLWKATNLYANNHDELLFINALTPLVMSNVIYRDGTVSAWGYLYPKYLPDYRVLFCPSDPVRDPEWLYGWENWDAEEGEVRISYGYRGRQNLVADADTALSLSEVDRNPQRVFACDFLGGETTPPNIPHPSHVNVLRCNGRVEACKSLMEFGPDEAGIQAALDALDR